MSELRVILAHLVSEFDFKDTYWQSGEPNVRIHVRQVYSKRAFQSEERSAHPSDHHAE